MGENRKETGAAGISEQDSLEDGNGGAGVFINYRSLLFYGDNKGGQGHRGNFDGFRAVVCLAVSDGVCSACVGLLRLSEVFSCAETEKSDCPYCGVCSIGISAVVYRRIPLCDKRHADCVNVCWQHTKN